MRNKSMFSLELINSWIIQVAFLLELYTTEIGGTELGLQVEQGRLGLLRVLIPKHVILGINTCFIPYPTEEKSSIGESIVLILPCIFIAPFTSSSSIFGVIIPSTLLPGKILYNYNIMDVLFIVFEVCILIIYESVNSIHIFQRDSLSLLSTERYPQEDLSLNLPQFYSAGGEMAYITEDTQEAFFRHRILSFIQAEANSVNPIISFSFIEELQCIIQTLAKILQVKTSQVLRILSGVRLSVKSPWRILFILYEFQNILLRIEQIAQSDFDVLCDIKRVDSIIIMPSIQYTTQTDYRTIKILFILESVILLIEFQVRVAILQSLNTEYEKSIELKATLSILTRRKEMASYILQILKCIFSGERLSRNKARRAERRFYQIFPSYFPQHDYWGRRVEAVVGGYKDIPGIDEIIDIIEERDGQVPAENYDLLRTLLLQRIDRLSSLTKAILYISDMNAFNIFTQISTPSFNEELEANRNKQLVNIQIIVPLQRIVPKISILKELGVDISAIIPFIIYPSADYNIKKLQEENIMHRVDYSLQDYKEEEIFADNTKLIISSLMCQSFIDRFTPELAEMFTLGQNKGVLQVNSLTVNLIMEVIKTGGFLQENSEDRGESAIGDAVENSMRADITIISKLFDSIYTTQIKTLTSKGAFKIRYWNISDLLLQPYGGSTERQEIEYNTVLFGIADIITNLLVIPDHVTSYTKNPEKSQAEQFDRIKLKKTPFLSILKQTINEHAGRWALTFQRKTWEDLKAGAASVKRLNMGLHSLDVKEYLTKFNLEEVLTNAEYRLKISGKVLVYVNFSMYTACFSVELSQTDIINLVYRIIQSLIDKIIEIQEACSSIEYFCAVVEMLLLPNNLREFGTSLIFQAGEDITGLYQQSVVTLYGQYTDRSKKLVDSKFSVIDIVRTLPLTSVEYAAYSAPIAPNIERAQLLLQAIQEKQRLMVVKNADVFENLLSWDIINRRANILYKNLSLVGRSNISEINSAEDFEHSFSAIKPEIEIEGVPNISEIVCGRAVQLSRGFLDSRFYIQEPIEIVIFGFNIYVMIFWILAYITNLSEPIKQYGGQLGGFSNSYNTAITGIAEIINLVDTLLSVDSKSAVKDTTTCYEIISIDSTVDFVDTIKKCIKTPIDMWLEYRQNINQAYQKTFERAPTTTVRKYTIFDLVEQPGTEMEGVSVPEYTAGYGDPSSGDTIKAGFIMAASIYSQRLRAELLILQAKEVQLLDSLYSFYGGYNAFVFEKVAPTDDPIQQLKILYLTDKIAGVFAIMGTQAKIVKNTKDAILRIYKLLPYIQQSKVVYNIIKNTPLTELNKKIEQVILSIIENIWIPEYGRFISRSQVAAIAVLDLIRVVSYLHQASVLSMGGYEDRPLLIGIPIWNTERKVFYAGLVGWEPETDRKNRNLSCDMVEPGILRIFDTLQPKWRSQRQIPQFILLWILSVLEYSLQYFFDTKYFGNVIGGERWPNIGPLESVIARLSQVVSQLAMWPNSPERAYIDRNVTVKELIGGIRQDTYYRRVVGGISRRRFTFPLSAAGTDRLGDWYERNILYREIMQSAEMLALKRTFQRAQQLPILGFFARVLISDNGGYRRQISSGGADIFDLCSFKNTNKWFIVPGISVIWAAYIHTLIKNKPFLITSISVDYITRVYKNFIVENLKQNTAINCTLSEAIDRTGVRLINADPRVRIYDTAYWLITQKNLQSVYRKIWYILELKYKPEYTTSCQAAAIIETKEGRKIRGETIIDITYLSLDERVVFIRRNLRGTDSTTKILCGDVEYCTRYSVVQQTVELLEYVLLLVVFEFEWEIKPVYDAARIQIIVNTVGVSTPRKILDSLLYEIPHIVVEQFFVLLSTVRRILLDYENHTYLGKFGRRVSAALFLEVLNGGITPNSIKLQQNLAPIPEELGSVLLNRYKTPNLDISSFRTFFIQIRSGRVKEMEREQWLEPLSLLKATRMQLFNAEENSGVLYTILMSIILVFIGVVNNRIKYALDKIKSTGLGEILVVFTIKIIPQSFPHTQLARGFVNLYNTGYYTQNFVDQELVLVTWVLDIVEKFVVDGGSGEVNITAIKIATCGVADSIIDTFKDALVTIGGEFIYTDEIFDRVEEQIIFGTTTDKQVVETYWYEIEREQADIFIKKLITAKIISFNEQAAGYDLIQKNEAIILLEAYAKDQSGRQKSLLKRLQNTGAITLAEKKLLQQEKDARLISRLVRSISRFIETIWAQSLQPLNAPTQAKTASRAGRVWGIDKNPQKIRRYYDKISHVQFYSERVTELDSLFTGGSTAEREIKDLQNMSDYREITYNIAERAEQSILLEKSLYGKPSKFVFSYSPFEPDWTAKKKISYGKKSVIVWELQFNKYKDAMLTHLQKATEGGQLLDRKDLRWDANSSILEREFRNAGKIPTIQWGSSRGSKAGIHLTAGYVRNLVQYNEVLHQKAQKSTTVSARENFYPGQLILEFIILEILALLAKN